MLLLVSIHSVAIAVYIFEWTINRFRNGSNSRQRVDMEQTFCKQLFKLIKIFFFSNRISPSKLIRMLESGPNTKKVIIIYLIPVVVLILKSNRMLN